MNNLPEYYDSWRLDNGEPDFFICDGCGEEYRVEELDDDLDLCKKCAEKELENE